MKVKKKVLLSLLCCSMVLASFVAFASSDTAGSYGSEYYGYTSVTNVSYSDVPRSYWAYDAIIRVGEKNWWGGYPDGTFRPNASVNRAEAIKVFVVSQGVTVTPVSSTSYPDIYVSDWYAPYVEAGKDQNGVSIIPVRKNFKGETVFLPNHPVTREDAVYALVKIIGLEPQTVLADQSVLNMFSDANSISADIKPYMSVALSYGLVSGFSDSTIRAQDPLSRAELATIMYRATMKGYLN